MSATVIHAPDDLSRAELQAAFGVSADAWEHRAADALAEGDRRLFWRCLDIARTARAVAEGRGSHDPT